MNNEQLTLEKNATFRIETYIRAKLNQNNFILSLLSLYRTTMFIKRWILMKNDLKNTFAVHILRQEKFP